MLTLIGCLLFWQPFICEAAVSFTALCTNPRLMDAAELGSIFSGSIFVATMHLYAFPGCTQHTGFCRHSRPWDIPFGADLLWVFLQGVRIMW
jgi:hypothetical protein